MNRDKVVDNLIDSSYVRFFAAYLNETWIYGPISYADFDNEIISLEEFSKRVKVEIKFSSPYFEESEEGKLPFIFSLYKEGSLEDLNEELYLAEITNPKICIVVTQDLQKGKNLFDYFLNTEDGRNFFQQNNKDSQKRK